MKNIHGIDHFDPEENRSLSDTTQPSHHDQVKETDLSLPLYSQRRNPDLPKTDLKYLDPVLKANFLKMKLQMVKCKKNRLNNANRRVRFKPTDCDDSDILDLSTHNKSEAPDTKTTKTDIHLNNNIDNKNIDSDSRDKSFKENLFSGANTENSNSMNVQNERDENNEGVLKNDDVKKNDFKCQECGKKFSSSKILKTHIRGCSAPSDSPYNCTLCERRFSDFDSLQKHWKVNHRRQQIV